MQQQIPHLLRSPNPTENETPEPFHFAVGDCFPLTLFTTVKPEELKSDFDNLASFHQAWKEDKTAVEWRSQWHARFSIPRNRPEFRHANHLFLCRFRSQR